MTTSLLISMLMLPAVLGADAPALKPGTHFDKIDYLMTGGLGAGRKAVTVSSDGTIRIAKEVPMSGRDHLSQEDLDKLDGLMGGVPWLTLRGEYRPAVLVVDAIQVDLFPTLQGQMYKLSIINPGNAGEPQALTDLVRFLDELGQRYSEPPPQAAKVAPGEFRQILWESTEDIGPRERHRLEMLITQSSREFTVSRSKRGFADGKWKDETLDHFGNDRLPAEEFKAIRAMVEAIDWEAAKAAYVAPPKDASPVQQHLRLMVDGGDFDFSFQPGKIPEAFKSLLGAFQTLYDRYHNTPYKTLTPER